MEKKILRAGIVGSGFAARFHYDALQHVFSTKVEIAGVYSVAEKELEDSAGILQRRAENRRGAGGQISGRYRNPKKQNRAIAERKGRAGGLAGGHGRISRGAGDPDLAAADVSR